MHGATIVRDGICRWHTTDESGRRQLYRSKRCVMWLYWLDDPARRIRFAVVPRYSTPVPSFIDHNRRHDAGPKWGSAVGGGTAGGRKFDSVLALRPRPLRSSSKEIASSDSRHLGVAKTRGFTHHRVNRGWADGRHQAMRDGTGSGGGGAPDGRTCGLGQRRDGKARLPRRRCSRFLLFQR